MKIAVGMSGGVDSAVTALLLKQQGHEVIGLFMKNWDEDACPAAEDAHDVARICDLIGIPYYTFNFTEEYWDRVFSQFLKELKEGHTPNPDILCNREIKFNVFFEKALHLKADALATGHYCQSVDGQLLKGNDPNKDQSYFLYTLKEEILRKVLFPIGHLPKSEVRRIAKEHNLPVATKKDSTGICFIGKRDFRPFVAQYLKKKEGAIISVEGKRVGTHEGAHFYTVGQRKGLGVGGPGEAWYVAGKEMATNTVIVAQGDDHPALYAPSLTATDVSWVASKAPTFPLKCKAKIRYRQVEEPCVVTQIAPDHIKVEFESPMRAITPRQAVVFYKDNVCLGGALIKD